MLFLAYVKLINFLSDVNTFPIITLLFTRIDGYAFMNVWVIAHIEAAKLRSIFEEQMDEIDQLQIRFTSLLTPYQALINREIDISRVVEWTIKYFQIVTNKQKLKIQFKHRNPFLNRALLWPWP